MVSSTNLRMKPAEFWEGKGGGWIRLQVNILRDGYSNETQRGNFTFNIVLELEILQCFSKGAKIVLFC